MSKNKLPKKHSLPRKKVPEPQVRPTTLLKAKLTRLRTHILPKRKSQSRLLKYRFHGIPYLYLAFFSFLLLSSLYFFRDLPSPKNLERDLYPISTEILDRNGKLLYKIYADENRTPIKLADLPSYIAESTVAIEDKNFYRHHGFDTGGIIRAAYKTLTGQRLEGGSTITQQLVKVALLSPERTVSRKIKEAVLALVTEILYSKDQILEMYLNHIPYGGTSYGIEAAAHRFFDKDARDLSLEETALLAGLPQAPSRYSPFGNPDSAKARQAQVLDAMVEEKYLTFEAALAAKNQTLSYAPPETNIRAPHFVMYVKELLESKYGIQQLERGGLRVTTTLDIDLQEATQASLSAEISSLKKLKVSNGAALITNPGTGEILAMIGSRDYFDLEIDGKVNVTTRLRQPGSSIKPLNYALGLETKVITPSTMLLDVPICFQVDNQLDYCPKNYDNSFRGPTQIRFALGNSYNIPAVKVLALNGLENFVSFAHRMGIQSWVDPSKYGLSLTLGGGEVTMADMTVAFGVLANSGTKVPLSPILKVEDYQGNILEEYLPAIKKQLVESTRDSLPSVNNLEKVLSPQTAFLISHILSDNNARSSAFGYSSVLNIPHHTVSVKTGTTNNLRDNWTIGFTSSRLVAVWVGNNDNTPMSYIASGITGASPIWQDLMKYVLQDLTPSDLYKPPTGIEGASVCSDSGVLPTADSPCSTRYEYFLDKTTPTTRTVEQKEIWINRDTHHPPLKPEEFDNVELQTHLLAKDAFSGDYCLDCEAYPEGYEQPALLVPFSTFVNTQTQ